MREYFCGRYFKCQSKDKTIAVIHAYHRAGGKTTCSIQIITDSGAWNAVFPYAVYTEDKKNGAVTIGGNYFGTDKMTLDIDDGAVKARGSVSFGNITPIKYDIMGPFRFVPFMECRHSVTSMFHTVDGEIEINGEMFVFSGDIGYIEGDRGYSFPKVYSWTQCCFEGGSLMLSVADIPFGPVHFTGIIGVIYTDGKERRIATYLGAKAEKIAGGEIVISQKKLKFTAKLIEKHAHPLYAPVGGEMTRVIRESASCRAYYKFEEDGKTLVEFESDKASFEYEYPK